jgi:fatty-acyl-CoA synthase
LSPARTLADAVVRAAESGEGRGFRFIKDEKWTEQFLSFEQIEAATARLAGGLQALGLRKGDRAALILPDNDQFVLTFLACLRAGVVPVPVYPPTGLGQLSGYLDNTSHIVGKSGALALVTTPVIKQMLGVVKAACPQLRHVTTFTTIDEPNQVFSTVDVSPDDIAFLQFTSGSTSRPKGVVLTHANLLANIENIAGEGLQLDPRQDQGLTWLPLFHDMGLIGFVLTPLVHTIQVTFMSPLQFLKRPAVWLQAMSRFHGTITFGPNFAYALCVKRTRPRELEGVDLSHWRVAGCGAEPIRAETLEQFADHFAPLGFRKSAFYPAYGLAESTLAVAFSRGVPTDDVQPSTLWEEGRAVPSDSTRDALRIVNCGKAFKGHEIGIFPLDDELGQTPLGDRQVGEIRLRGPSVSRGYYQEPETTAKAFVNGWFRTGDLGYLVDGDLFICGRQKEVIIVNGRNFYPQDIEWEASQIDGVRKGNVIAFGTHGVDRDRESVVLAFETSVTDPDAHARMASDIRARVQERIGITIDDVVVLAAGALPKTSSGKLQRTRTRELYDNGELSSRRSQREVDRVDQVKNLAKSQLAYLKLAVLGGRRNSS